jgi:uncharacterized membrane protein YhaH (DUF805 family)
MWSSIAIAVKRWHDFGKSGWFQMLAIVPYAGILVEIILGFIPGTRGANRFGDDPIQSAGGHPMPGPVEAATT